MGLFTPGSALRHGEPMQREEEPQQRIAVVGASGRTGRLVVDRALADGHLVTAVARHPEAGTTCAAKRASWPSPSAHRMKVSKP